MKTNIILALVILNALSSCVAEQVNEVALQAANGQYVCAESGGGDKIVANRNAIGPWETFNLIDRGDGNVALRASNGQYMCAEGGGGGEVVANRNVIGPWETFSLFSIGYSEQMREVSKGCSDQEGDCYRGTLSVNEISPSMQKNVLKIWDTKPIGVSLWIQENGKWKDTNKKCPPCSWMFDKKGIHTFKLSYSGYKDFTRKVDIEGLTELSKRINLVKQK